MSLIQTVITFAPDIEMSLAQAIQHANNSALYRKFGNVHRNRCGRYRKAQKGIHAASQRNQLPVVLSRRQIRVLIT